jgi:predicted nuclease of predicted toxin-antitoxin system
MKILLDEHIPSKVRLDFGDTHEIVSARRIGWDGKKNGELLGLMTLNGFDVLITMDKSIEHPKPCRFPITIILLRAESNKHEVIQPLIPQVLALLKGNLKRGVLTVE